MIVPVPPLSGVKIVFERAVGTRDVRNGPYGFFGKTGASEIRMNDDARGVDERPKARAAPSREYGRRPTVDRSPTFPSSRTGCLSNLSRGDSTPATVTKRKVFAIQD